MPKGFVYILECSDGSYYTGSTVDIDTRLAQHNDGQGANHTKKRLPVQLVYLEEFQRIDDAFYREKQIQRWSRVKKEALIENNFDKLPELSIAYRDKVASRTSATKKTRTSATGKSSGFENLSHQKIENLSHQKNKNSSVPEVLEGTIPKTYKSNGKLLLTGEYVVLDGAKTLAVPTKYGQNLSIEPNDSNAIVWKSFNELGEIWFEDEFLITKSSNRLNLKAKNYIDISKRLIQILKATYNLNPEFINSNQGYTITTHQDFNRLWGLGTSSTLINNISNWANVDAYKLLKQTFGGSGYDIACAQHNTPITFQLDNDTSEPTVETVSFNPSFKNHLYFVYLNQKQNSRDGIASYKKNAKIDNIIIDEVNTITERMITCATLSEFETLINTHEAIISKLIQQDTIKNQLFNDFNGSMKSLGAWGGDFVLATSITDPTDYFISKGFETIIPYTEMVL